MAHPPPPAPQQAPQPGEYLRIGNLQPNMNNFNIVVIVLDGGHGLMRRTQNGSTIQVLKVADPTGSINMTLMNCDVPDLFQAGDIVKLKSAFTNIHRGCLTLGCHSRSGEYMKIGEFFMAYQETPYFSEFNSDLAAIERARKPSPPPPDAEGNNGGPVDPRRPPGIRPGLPPHKRSAPTPHSGAGAPPPKRMDGPNLMMKGGRT